MRINCISLVAAATFFASCGTASAAVHTNLGREASQLQPAGGATQVGGETRFLRSYQAAPAEDEERMFDFLQGKGVLERITATHLDKMLTKNKVADKTFAHWDDAIAKDESMKQKIAAAVRSNGEHYETLLTQFTAAYLRKHGVLN